MARKACVLVDGMNLAYRAHYVFRGLESADGIPTGVLYGFLRGVHALRHFTERIIVCWDHGVPGVVTRKDRWRSRIYPEYKAKRREPDADLEPLWQQLSLLVFPLRYMGIYQVGHGCLEADDLFGLLASYWSKTRKVYLYSTDRDLYQLLEAGRVEIIRATRRGKAGWISVTAQDAVREFGVPIHLWAHYLALGGDTSDNIHPLPGVGPKRAAALVAAGADPTQSFRKQPRTFRDQYKNLSDYWPRVQAAYRIVCLPRDCATIEEYIPNCPTTVEALLRSITVMPASEPYPHRLQRFTTFCADHDLLEFIGDRRKLCR